MADQNDITRDVTLYDELGNKVAVVADGSIFRLGVDAKITGGVVPQRSSPKFDFQTTPIVVADTVEVSLKSVTGKGALDFFTFTASKSDWEFIIKIDGSEELRISSEDMSDLSLESSNATTIPLFASNADKTFTLHPNVGMDFKTSFDLRFKATSSGQDVIWFAKWREVIT